MLQEDKDETISTLRFGTRTKNVKNVVHVNKALSPDELQAKIDTLMKVRCPAPFCTPFQSAVTTFLFTCASACSPCCLLRIASRVFVRPVIEQYVNVLERENADLKARLLPKDPSTAIGLQKSGSEKKLTLSYVMPS